MTRFTRSDDLQGAEFQEVNLTGARFVGVDLTDAVVRGSEINKLELDSPWLLEGDGFLRVNGVDVRPLVDAELNNRFPGRELRLAKDPTGLQAAWAALEQTWAATVERAAAMPDGTIDRSVAGEWSFTQTLRHLVFATDMWLGKAILASEQPFHPLGVLDAGTAGDDRAGDNTGTQAFAVKAPPYPEVLAARAGRQAMVREFLNGVTDDVLAETRPNPHAPQRSESVLSCLHTITEEEWEHHRYAVRDLDLLAADAGS